MDGKLIDEQKKKVILMEEVQEWFAVSDLVSKFEVSENTLKRYIRRHEDFLVVKQGNRGKYYIYHDSLKVLKLIKKLYGDNKNEIEVNEYLEENGIAMVINVSDEENADNRDETLSVNMVDMVKTWNERFDQLEKINHEQNEELKLLKEVVQKQTEYIDHRLNERDRNFMESIRALQEERKSMIETVGTLEQAMEEQKKENKKWWKFW
jgi:hypothetical protein